MVNHLDKNKQLTFIDLSLNFGVCCTDIAASSVGTGVGCRYSIVMVLLNTSIKILE
jgi:hypothetical protein